MKIKDALINGKDTLDKSSIKDSTQKARRLLAFVLNKEKEYLMIHENDDVNDKIYDLYMENINRLSNHEPIQYIIGMQEFMGFSFNVDKNVLIPQPDTENLVEEVVKIAQEKKIERPKILDLCTGSGAIAISLAKLVKNSIVYGSDISRDALNVAENNSILNQANVLFIKSDMFKNIYKDYRFNIIVSNPPYIETETIVNLDKEVQNEPHLALDGGEDGLKFYREIAENAKNYLEEDGYLALEIGFNQKDEVAKILKDNGYKNIYFRKDLSGINRVIICQV